MYALDEVLSQIKSVQHQDMMIILGQSDDVALRGDFEATASGHLHVRTLELAEHISFSREHGHMKAIAVTVAHKHISRIAHVYAIREVGDILAADAPQKRAFFVKHGNTMAFKIAHKVLVAIYGDITRFSHMLGAVEPLKQVALFRNAEYSGRNGVHGYNIAIVGDGDARYDVYVADGYLFEEMARLAEDLHAWALISAIAHYKFGGASHDRHFSRVPQLAFFAAWRAECVLEFARGREDLYAVIVGVRYNYFFAIVAQTEAVRRIKLSFGRAQCAEFYVYGHVGHLAVLSHRRIQVAVARELRFFAIVACLTSAHKHVGHVVLDSIENLDK